jgi:hypothetical protein
MYDATCQVDYSTKPISELAWIVRRDWKKVNFAAVPYLDAMLSLNSVNDAYGLDSGASVVLYFLSNASSWRGPVAKAIKTELKRRVNSK